MSSFVKIGPNHLGHKNWPSRPGFFGFFEKTIQSELVKWPSHRFIGLISWIGSILIIIVGGLVRAIRKFDSDSGKIIGLKILTVDTRIFFIFRISIYYLFILDCVDRFIIHLLSFDVPYGR